MKIQKILEQTIPGLGYEFVDVEITPTKLIRVYIDKDGGVTIDDCEKVSHHLSNLFLVETIDYNRLEVSSPGVDRPLKKIEDYIRFIGKTIKVKSRELIEEQKVFQGIIQSINDNLITLELEKGRVLTLAFENISRARLVFELPKKTPIRKK